MRDKNTAIIGVKISMINNNTESEELKNFSSELFQKLEELSREEIFFVIMTHDHADVDAISSVIGLYYIISNFCSIKSSNIIPYVTNIGKNAKFIYEQMSIDEIIKIQDNIDDIQDSPKCILLVDSNTIDLEIYKNNIDTIKSIVIIDHHNFPSYLMEEENNDSEISKILNKIAQNKDLLHYINSISSSCAEIIAEIWSYWNNDQEIISKNKNSSKLMEIQDESISQLLLNGIFVDSANLRYSYTSILPILVFLSEQGAKIENIGEFRQKEWTLDEKIARIKGAIRVEEPIVIRKDIIFVFTKVNAYEASVSRALIDLGADIAFCFSKQKKNNYRVSGRTSNKLQKDYKFDLGIFLEKVGYEISASGGGHKGAAGMRGENPPDDLKEILITKLKREINDVELKKSI